jgi:hypothetical protein
MGIELGSAIFSLLTITVYSDINMSVNINFAITIPVVNTQN